MMDFIDLMAVVGFFLLRVGVPLAITAGVVYLLKRLDRRWEMEARADQRAGKAAEQPAVGPEAEKPVSPKRAPAPELPFIPPPAVPDRRIQPGLAAGAAVQPGLSSKSGRSAKAQCAAPQNTGKPCWQTRLDAEGQIPEECVGCDIFQRYPVM
jgi:hypothetical protein